MLKRNRFIFRSLRTTLSVVAHGKLELVTHLHTLLSKWILQGKWKSCKHQRVVTEVFPRLLETAVAGSDCCFQYDTPITQATGRGEMIDFASLNAHQDSLTQDHINECWLVQTQLMQLYYRGKSPYGDDNHKLHGESHHMVMITIGYTEKVTIW